MPRRPLAHYDHVERALDVFPTYMITFFSVIQSIVLGYLLLTIKDQLVYPLAGVFPDPVWITAIIATFLLVITVWQEYVIASITFEYVPNLPDALIIFLFGLTQALVVFSIDYHRIVWYCFSMSSVCIVAFLAYVNALHEAKWNLEKNRVALELSRNLYRISKSWILVYSIPSFLFGISEILWPSRLNPLYIVIIIAASLVAWLIRGHIFWRKLVQI